MLNRWTVQRKHDPAREHRILYEVIVDCYDDEELMGWYYYMAEGLEFPIDVTVRFTLKNGKTEAKPAQIVHIDPKSERGNPIRLGITEPGSERMQYISPEELASADTTPENLEILNDWLYWHDFELLED